MNTIKLFPRIHPDEEFRSIIYRYALRLNTSIPKIYRELIGLNSQYVPFLPSRLTQLQQRIPSLNGCHSFLFENTYYPLFSTFLNEEVRTALLSRMTDREKGYIASLVPNIISRSIRYCVYCMADNVEEYGEVYIHRSHQIGNIDVCYKHRSKLIGECPTCGVTLGELYGRKFIGTANCPNGHDLLPSLEKEHLDQIDKIKIELACDINKILNREIEINNIFEAYQQITIEHGYRIKNSIYRNPKFKSELLEKYPPSTLEELGVLSDFNLKQRKRRTALYIFDEKRASRNPVVHLLIINWLMQGCDKLTNYKLKSQGEVIPFGDGPWVCINKLCPYYGHYVVQLQERWIDYKKRKIHKGKFLCEHCGMIYRGEDDLGEISSIKIIELGSIWYSKIITAYKKNMSLRGTATSVGTSRGIVKKYILRYLEEHSENTNQNLIHETEVISAMHETAATSEPKIVPKLVPRRGKEKSGWELVDSLLASKVEEISKVLYSNPPNRKIMKNTIISHMSVPEKSRINKKGAKLPRTIKILKQYVESKEDYQRRIIPHVYEMHRRIYGNTNLKQMLQSSQLKGCSALIMAEIQNYLTDPPFK